MTKRKKKKGRKPQKGRRKKGNRQNFKRFTDVNKKFTDLLEKVITNFFTKTFFKPKAQEKSANRESLRMVDILRC